MAFKLVTSALLPKLVIRCISINTCLNFSSLTSTTCVSYNLKSFAIPSSSLNQQEHQLVRNPISFQRRFKKKTRNVQDNDDDDEDEDEDDDGLADEENPLLMDDLLSDTDPNLKRMTINVPSLRLDSVGKVAFSVTRQKIEESFYKGNLFINGERPDKKAADLHQGDEIDLVKGPNKDNSVMWDVMRVVITKVPDKASNTGRFNLEIEKLLQLTIEPHDKEVNED